MGHRKVMHLYTNMLLVLDSGRTSPIAWLLIAWWCKEPGLEDFLLQCGAVYNAVNFLQNIHETHPIARLSGRGMGCLLCIQPLIDILPQFLQCCMQYHVILNRVIMALDCTLSWLDDIIPNGRWDPAKFTQLRNHEVNNDLDSKYWNLLPHYLWPLLLTWSNFNPSMDK